MILSTGGDFEKLALHERVSKPMRKLVEALWKFPSYSLFKDQFSKPVTPLLSFWFTFSFYILIFGKDYENMGAIVKGAQVPFLRR